MLDETLTLALETIRKKKQALVFVPSRASAEKTAEDISKQTKIYLTETASQVLKGVSSPTKQCRRLANCVKKGIAFHHAGLTQKQKTLIEDEFRSGKIKIICATPTLACGMSLPAFRVIIKSLKRYTGRWGMNWIPVLEYHQMAGRAGRPEYESFGEAITIAKNEKDKGDIHEKYVCGAPEDIYSKLAVEPVFRTYLLSLIATGITNTKKKLIEFFSKTFWAYQFQDMDKVRLMIDQMLELLEQYEFIKIQSLDQSGQLPFDSDFIPASAMDQPDNSEENIFLKPTLIGKRVSELYLDPFTANHLIECLKNSTNSKLEVTPFSFLQMISNTLEMVPPLRIKVREQDEIQEKLVEKYTELLQIEPSLYDPNYEDFINSIKTSLFFEAWIDEQGEDFLLEKYGIRPGEIYAKLSIAEWLLYSSSELARLLQFQPLLKEINRLRVRVKNGVKEELLALLKLKGIGRKRARKLFSNGLTDLGEVKRAQVSDLVKLLGNNLALDVKKQLGVEIKAVPKGKRKGQLGLRKY